MNNFINANISFKEIYHNFNMSNLYVDYGEIINDYDLEMNVHRGDNISYIYGTIKLLNHEKGDNFFINIARGELIDYKFKFHIINKYKLRTSGKYIIKVPNNIIGEIQLIVTKK